MFLVYVIQLTAVGLFFANSLGSSHWVELVSAERETEREGEAS